MQELKGKEQYVKCDFYECERECGRMETNSPFLFRGYITKDVRQTIFKKKKEILGEIDEHLKVTEGMRTNKNHFRKEICKIIEKHL